jgi:hypothetical protein
MNRLFASCIFVLTAVMVSGCIFSSDDGTEVKKGAVSGTVTMSVTGAPLTNVKVYLINRAAKIDSVNYRNNQAAFVDSAFTNTEGKYTIGNITPGKYCVAPVNGDAETLYSFAVSANSDSGSFAMNGDSRTVNFTATVANPPAAENNTFKIVLYFKLNNLLNSDKIKVYRRLWAWFVPGWAFQCTCYKEPADGNRAKFIIEAAYGYTALVYSWDNYFEATFTADSVERSVDFGFGISNTPAYSSFEYDLASRTLTRLE